MLAMLRMTERALGEEAWEGRMFVLASAEIEASVRRQLAPLALRIDFLREASALSPLVAEGVSYGAALIPASLPANAWWSLWGEIALLYPRPEILVYASTADFELWSSVLEMGGFDVLVEPFRDEALRDAVRRALRNFEERAKSKED